MLVHIVKPSGFGKFTIGEFFNKLGVIVINTDDIDDKNNLKLLKNMICQKI